MPQHHPKQTNKTDPPVAKAVSSKRLAKIKAEKEEEEERAKEIAAVQAEVERDFLTSRGLSWR